MSEVNLTANRPIEVIPMHEFLDINEDPAGAHKTFQALNARLDAREMLHLDFLQVEERSVPYLRMVLNGIQVAFDRSDRAAERGAMAVINLNTVTKNNLLEVLNLRERKLPVPVVAEATASGVVLLPPPEENEQENALAKLFSIVLKETLEGKITTAPQLRDKKKVTDTGSLHDWLSDLVRAGAIARKSNNKAHGFYAITPIAPTSKS